jgi:CheY-like chemotaxis protein/anti-sigma regulatory factor (Ser/Thr protein kinase)
VTEPPTWRSVPAVTVSSGDPHRDLTGVLHDVANALTVLLGWVGEAREPEATPEAVAYALKIIDQRARIARDLARHAIGGPRFDEQREAVKIVGEVAESLRVEAQRKQAKIVVSGAETEARLAGALDVSQVVTNIVMNALAYAPTGSTVSVHVSSDEETATIVVTDEGAGVEAGRSESIFRGDSLRPGGIGVGLRHSREIAQAADGNVEILPNDPSRSGARFRITWPRADAMPRPPMSTSRVNELVGVRVLVVEDDAAVTQLLETALDARGAQVTIAGNAEELTRALAAGPYDAALVDLSPIASDAEGALASLRAACRPEASIVLITGSADALPEAVSAASLDLVRKPFEVREVLAALVKKKPT